MIFKWFLWKKCMVEAYMRNIQTGGNQHFHKWFLKYVMITDNRTLKDKKGSCNKILSSTKVWRWLSYSNKGRSEFLMEKLNLCHKVTARYIRNWASVNVRVHIILSYADFIFSV